MTVSEKAEIQNDKAAEPQGRPGFDYRMTKEEIADLPLFKFEGPIRIVSKAKEVAAIVERLEEEKVLGFDTETRPAFKKGQSYSPALLQLAHASEAYLFMLKKIGMPPRLCRLLANRKVLKVGVAPGQDVRKLQEISPFDARGFVDLSDMSRDLGIMNHGMRGLAAVLLSKRMSKRAQVSNWEKDPLDSSQVSYAGTDAWLSRELYFNLKKTHGITPKPIDYPMFQDRPAD